MGVILRHKIKVGDVVFSNDLYAGGLASEASVEVQYAIGAAPEFRVELRDVPLTISKALGAQLEGSPSDETGGVPIEIELGYFDGARGKVLDGRVGKIGAAISERPLTTLSGYETALYKLLRRTKVDDVESPPATLQVSEVEVPVPALVARVAQKAGVSVDGLATPDSGLKDQTFTAPNALRLLDELADAVGAEWFVQDGKLAFGLAVRSPMPASALAPDIPNPAALVQLAKGDEVLVEVGGAKSTRLADLKPLTVGPRPERRVVTDKPDEEAVGAFDFIALGEPSLRAGQIVIASTTEYANPFQRFRILSVTHRYSPREGYTCSGRAATMASDASPYANRQRTDAARIASPDSIVARLGDRSRREDEERPTIDVGRVAKSDPEKRTASFHFRQVPVPGQASTSVDAEIPADGPQLTNRPLTSPFAWHKVGLSVPVYPGMRALLAQVRGSRRDAVATGFLWTNEPQMERPKAKDGDWWLCLPTELGGDDRPTGKGANDLTAADGRRVVEAKGLLVKVGADKLSPVGDRPAEGSADELEIQHASGATVKIASDGAVTVQAASGKALTLTDGSTKVEIGSGKVSVQ
jgi:hypothetical protein